MKLEFFFETFSKNLQISNFIKINPVGAIFSVRVESRTVKTDIQTWRS